MSKRKLSDKLKKGLTPPTSSETTKSISKIANESDKKYPFTTALTPSNRVHLQMIAKEKGVKMAVILNQILDKEFSDRKKTPTYHFYLKELTK